jgi:glycosyltransferase involved in cell wall biosynthesis
MDHANRIVLSNYPLSRAYQESLSEALGVLPQFIAASELRRNSVLSLVGRLFSIRGAALYVATEDESSRALLPMLCMLASMSRVRRLHTIDDRFEIREFGRHRAAAYAGELTVTSLRALLTLRRAVKDLQRLSEADRVAVRAGAGMEAYYLNCNLWLGVKAGGSVGHVSGVVNALMDRGYATTFFSAGGRLLVDERANFVPLRAPAKFVLPFEMNYYEFDRACENQISTRIDVSPPALIYQRMSLGNYTGVRLSRSHRVPLVLEYNGSEAWVAKHWGRPLRYHDAAVLAEEVCLKHAHLVVTVSDVLGRELESRGVDPRRIVVYPNCVDPKIFNPERFTAADSAALRGSLGLEKDDLVATFIGTFGQWHGVDVLARAIRQMIAVEKEFLDTYRLRFLLIGDGLKMSLVREILAGAEHGPYVRMTGIIAQAEAPNYLYASDVLLSPHVRNADGTAFFGSPTKLFEYMAVGRGIVASDLEQIGEILCPAIDPSLATTELSNSQAVAVLVPPGNVDQLIAGIKLLATRRDVRLTIGANARQLALARYTWAHHTDAILAGLARVVT